MTFVSADLAWRGQHKLMRAGEMQGLYSRNRTNGAGCGEDDRSVDSGVLAGKLAQISVSSSFVEMRSPTTSLACDESRQSISLKPPMELISAINARNALRSNSFLFPL